MWKVMKIAGGKTKEIWRADFAPSPGTQLTIDGTLYEVLLHERAGDGGWVYVSLVSTPRAQ
jgi:hypothetical protein